MDVAEPDGDIDWIRIDLTSDASVAEAFATFRERHGRQIASVVHLAAYFDFSGEYKPLYEQVNVEGTRRLLRRTAPAEVARPVRLLNIIFGVALPIVPFACDAEAASLWSSLLCGIALIALSLRRGAIRQRYGAWNRLLV